MPGMPESSSPAGSRKPVVVVALIADLRDEEAWPRVRLTQPADPDARSGVELRPVTRIEPRRGLEHRGRIRRRLGEMDHVAGVHPAAGEIEPPAVERSTLDGRVVEMRRAVEGRLATVGVPREE